VSSITIASGQEVSVKSDYQANTGETIDISIDMVNAQSIGAIDITLTYDSSVLTATKVSSSDLTSGSMISGNTDVKGTVTIGIVDVSGFSGDGSIAKITFEVIGSDNDTSSLTLSSVSASDTNFNDVTLTTQNGKFTVGTSACGVPGDLNEDGKVTSLDALMTFQISVGIIETNQCADVNGDGKVTSLDALILLQKAVGLITLFPVNATEEKVVQLAKEDLANRTKVSIANIKVLKVTAVEWSDTSLGCPKYGMVYAQVITPGFKIILGVDGQEYVYHSSYTRVIYCESVGLITF